MYEVLRDQHLPTRTHLHIGALDSVPKQIILELTKSAYQAGNCIVSLAEGRAHEILPELAAHRIDLFVTDVIPDLTKSRTFTHRFITKERIGIYGAPKFKELRDDFPRSLQEQKFVMPTFDSRLRHELSQWLKSRNIVVDVIAETQDISLKKQMAIEGLGLIPTASYTVEKLVKAGVLLEIGILEDAFEEIYLIAADRKIANPIAKALMNDFSL